VYLGKVIKTSLHPQEYVVWRRKAKVTHYLSLHTTVGVNVSDIHSHPRPCELECNDEHIIVIVFLFQTVSC
jgi:hypothetical protein